MGEKWGEKKLPIFLKTKKMGRLKKKKRAIDEGHKKNALQKKMASFEKTKTRAHGLIKKKTKRPGDGGKKRCPSDKNGLLIEKKKGRKIGT
jgi:hypothetical protein